MIFILSLIPDAPKEESKAENGSELGEVEKKNGEDGEVNIKSCLVMNVLTFSGLIFA